MPVVAGTDGSAHAERAVAWAADEAALRGLPLRIVHTLARWGKDMPVRPPRDAEEALPTVGQRLLDEAARQARERHPDLAVTTELLRESMPFALRDEAGGAFEIVLGHRGLGGFRSLLLGSTALRVAGRTEGPVVIVRGRVLPAYGEITLGVDPFEEQTASLEYAFEAAAVRGARLRAVHAFQLAAPDDPAVTPDDVAAVAREELAKVLAPLTERFPQVEVVQQVVQDHPVNALVDLSENTDLLVLGAHGHTALGGLLLGAISHGVLHHAHCPIAIVRPRS
ncbi:universal stress protein [Actinomadura viridis]|uniref:Nucleotide-binding universal stress UspA family protein n=1 Tax=Actinomadura viridis TaxID=58110 RepID=A0A931DTL7_9ACTN|nr:universal stress protein [Actinomadura viridis]MBG6093641.1 nucleotide-binding universal stress UspA family protein [Actinomadura viridis]